MQNKDIKGTEPGGDLIQFLKLLRQCNIGKLSAAEFGKRVRTREGSNIDCAYMGDAIKL